MRAKDMQPGVVYAYQEGANGRTTPVVVLDTEKLYRETMERARYGHALEGGPAWEVAEGETKAHVSQGFHDRTVGYLAVKPSAYGERPAAPEDLLADDLPTLVPGVVVDEQDLSERGMTSFLANPRWLIGTWDEHIAAQERATKAHAEWRAAQDRNRAAAHAEAQAASAHLTALGIAHTVTQTRSGAPTYSIVLTPAEAMKISASPATGV